MSCPVDTSHSQHSQHLFTELEEQNDDDCCYNTTSIGAWIDTRCLLAVPRPCSDVRQHKLISHTEVHTDADGASARNI